jgi:hypothetical protein
MSGRLIWKQVAQKHTQGELAPYFEDEEAYSIMTRVSDACDAHLLKTSLEYLANRGEFKLFPVDLTLVPSAQLSADCDRLKTLFLRDFLKHNENRKDSAPTKNELVFLVLAEAHYTITARSIRRAEQESNLRVEPTADSLRLLLNARIRLGEWMSVHGHVVSGKPYETRQQRAQRRRDNRLSKLCPSDYTIVEWQAMRMRQEAEDNLERRKEEMEKQLIDERSAKKRVAAGSVEPRSSPLLDQRRWRPAAKYPDVEEAMADVSYFLTCYYNDGPDVLREELEHNDDVVASNLDRRDALTNSSRGGALGLLWNDDPRLVASAYLIAATQFFAQAWSEEYWRNRFPVVNDVDVDTASFARYVIGRMDSQELQEEHMKEFTTNCYEQLMPIGARGLSQRMVGTRSGDTRRLLYTMHGVSVVSEVDEMFDTESARRLVAYDETHPLFDALSLMLVQFTCYAETQNDFSMISQCTIPTSQIIRQGKALDDTSEIRRPWIVKICGEWMVHDRGEWWRPTINRFGAAWLVFLALLKQRYQFNMDVVTNLGYWETNHGCVLPIIDLSCIHDVYHSS